MGSAPRSTGWPIRTPAPRSISSSASKAGDSFWAAPWRSDLGPASCRFASPGNCPRACRKETYDLEYGTDALEIHEDAVQVGQRVLIVDDVLATGGTAAAAARLVRRVGGELHGLAFLIELMFLNGQSKLEGEKVHSVLEDQVASNSQGANAQDQLPKRSPPARQGNGLGSCDKVRIGVGSFVE